MPIDWVSYYHNVTLSAIMKLMKTGILPSSFVLGGGKGYELNKA